MKGRILTGKHIAAFAVYLRSEEKRKNTVAKYSRDVRAFAAYAGEAAITKEMVIAYKSSLLFCAQNGKRNALHGRTPYMDRISDRRQKFLCENHCKYRKM